MKNKYKISFLFIPLFLIFSHAAYAERPTMGISGVTGSSGTVSINYSASDSAENINTCSWQYSTDGTIWYPLEDSAIGNNGGKVSGISYITWNSTAGTYNLADSSSSSVYFRIRSYDNQGLVWVSSAIPFSPYAGACWNERNERVQTVESNSPSGGELAGYDSELNMTDSNWTDINFVEGLSCELAAGATYLWQGRNGYLHKTQINNGAPFLTYIDTYTTVFNVTGLAWDGNNLWGCGSSAGVNGYVFKYLDPTIDSYNYWYWATNPVFSGLTWDGETLWSASPGAANNIALHNIDSILNISKILTCDSLPYGLGSDGENLYVTTWDGGTGYGIYKYNIPVSTYSTYGPFTINNVPPEVNNPPAFSINSISGNSGTLTINYTASDSDGDNASTYGWQYSQDNSTWYDIDQGQIGNNSYKSPGASYITWRSTAGTNNLDGVADTSVYFRMKVTDDNSDYLTVIATYNSPSYDLEGLTWDGTNIWSSKFGKIYKHNMDATLSVAETYDVYYYGMRGLAWDEANIWSCYHYSSGGLNVYEINKHNMDDTLSFNDQYWISGRYGLTWDGANIWSCNYGSGEIYKHNMDVDLTVSNTYDSPDSYPSGLTWDGTNIWSCYEYSNRIYKHNMDVDLSTAATFNSPSSYPTGLAWDGTNIWSCVGGDGETDEIYRHRLGLSSAYGTSSSFSIDNNNAPTLGWKGTGSYVSDGLDYEQGTTTMTYTYEVNYTDSDNNTPASGYPTVWILKGGTTVQTLSMALVSGTSYDGNYSTATKLTSVGTDYTYYFEAYDSNSAAATGSPTGSVDAPDVKGLVGYWSFDEGSGTTASDSSGFGNGGTLFGPGWTTGKVGSALDFDGTDDYVRVDDNDILDLTEDFTLQAIIKAQDVWSNKNIITKHEYDEFAGQWTFGVYKSSVIFQGLSGGFQSVYSADILVTDKWYHLSVTYNDTVDKCEVFVNGELSNSVTQPITVSNTDKYLMIGAQESNSVPGTGVCCFNGIIDEVKIYNYARTAEQISQDSQDAGISTETANNAPVLGWVGEGNYTSDGLNPEAGTSTTTFMYSVKYTDADNDIPASGYPKVWILKGGTTVQTLSMELDPANTAYNGNYSTATTLSSAGTDYTYYFEAYDSNSSGATGEPTGSVDAPDVSADAPASFTDDFESATLNPFWEVTQEYGSISLTTEQSHSGSQSAKFSSISGGQRYIFLTHAYSSATAVKGKSVVWIYDTAPGSETQYVQLAFGNKTIEGQPGSRFSIGIEDWVTSYYCLLDTITDSIVTTNISRTTGWHKFEIDIASASMSYYIDGSEIATYAGEYGFNSVQLAMFAPNWRPDATYYFDDFSITVGTTNTAPVLDWVGTSGYENDGLDYETGTTTTVFTYKVKYMDANGDAPAAGYPKVHIYRTAVPVQTLTLEYVSGSYSSGAFYSTSTKLSEAGSDYTYYFEAYDSNSALAAGSPASSVDAPDVTVGNNSPMLTWVGTAGYESDGVAPDAGDTGTNFVFKVKYTDADDDAPMAGYPRVDLGLDGWHTMNEDDGADTVYSDGKIYKFETYLDTTRDGYFFTAYDANSNIAAGEATLQKGGPAVSNPGYYAIYGYVLDHSSNPILNITVGLYDNSVSPPSRIQYQISNSYGFYEFNSIEYGKNCFVNIESSNYTFLPAGPSGMDFLYNDMRVDFFGTAAGAAYYSVSGRCHTADNQGLDNAFVALNYLIGGEYSHVHADSSGDFSFTNVPGGNYELIAKTFSGDTSLHTGDGITMRFVYEPLSSNKAGQNFYLGGAVFESNDFKVWGNVFNPRSASCEIKFTAMENDNVDVKIYDTAGRVIRNWQTNTGIFSWDGRDNGGAVVANGVYYIHIKSNNINKAYPVAIIKK
ncbi:MAG: LamG-like jellyroll fold domain-containing protein [bacterium]